MFLSWSFILLLFELSSSYDGTKSFCDYLNGTDSFRGSWNGCGGTKFFIYAGVEFPGASFFLENSQVYTWYLLTDRTCTSIAEILEFLIWYLRREWNVEFSSGIGIESTGTSRAIVVPRGGCSCLCKTTAFQRGHFVFLAEMGEWLVGIT